MRKFREVEYLEFKRVIDCIQCNFCAKEFMNDSEYNDHPITQFCIEPGYGSIFDGENLEFDICDNCLDELKNITKIPPF